MFRQKIKLCISCMLIVLCGAGAIRAVRVAGAVASDHVARHGKFYSAAIAEWQKPEIRDPIDITRRARSTEKNFPENYRFFTYAAYVFLTEAQDARNRGLDDLYTQNIGKALHFSKMAVGLNPYDEHTRNVYVDILVEAGEAAKAVDFWRTTVIDREFWLAINQNKMAELYLASGTPEHLREAMKMVPPEDMNDYWLIGDPELKQKLRMYKNFIK